MLASLKHILVGCKHAQGWYTWQHNQVLRCLAAEQVFWSNSCQHAVLHQADCAFGGCHGGGFWTEKALLCWSSNCGCDVEVQPFEVGCRGFVASSIITRVLKNFEISEQVQSKAFKVLCSTAERSNHWLWIKIEKILSGHTTDNVSRVGFTLWS